MKKRMIPMILAAGALVLPVLFSGCSWFGGKDRNLKALEGHWVDVNGDTTLDFKGNRMTVRWGNFEESYKVRVSKTGLRYVENTSKDSYDQGFGMISKLEIMEDGRVLSAYEQVLDGEGHTYRFVREEDLEKETAVTDNSRDLPKKIESDEITDFSFSFSLLDTHYDVPADQPWESGAYFYEIEQLEDGSYQMKFSAAGSSYLIYNYSGTVSADYVQGLAKLLQDQKVPSYNGWSKTNNESFHEWSLNVDYASGEKLRLAASGRPSLEIPFSVYAFLQYADLAAEVMPKPETAPESETEPDTGSEADPLESYRGHWADVNSRTTLDFDGDRMVLNLYGGYEETYTVRLEGNPDYQEIVNAGDENDRGFGIMGALHVLSDGALEAYELVMDAAGHHFHFVREEELSNALQVEDLSEDLPKQIESEEIESFSLSFSLVDTKFDVPEDSPFPGGRYTISVEKNGDGGYELDFDAMGDSYVICQYDGAVSEDFVRGLAALIQEEKIPEQNGTYLTNIEDIDGWSLVAEYESGEELQLIREGRPALECPFSINAFLEYVNREVKFEGL